jgi:hypothetical protein
VDDAEPVREHRPLGGLWQEVVHDAEDRRGQEERDRVVPVPPLHERVLYAAEDRVALERANRDRQRVDDMQHRDGDDRRDVEPQRDVQMLFVAPLEREKEVRRKDQPDRGDRQIDRPLELRVLLALRRSERERDGGSHDDRLPTPEVNP